MYVPEDKFDRTLVLLFFLNKVYSFAQRETIDAVLSLNFPLTMQTTTNYKAGRIRRWGERTGHGGEPHGGSPGSRRRQRPGRSFVKLIRSIDQYRYRLCVLPARGCRIAVFKLSGIGRSRCAIGTVSESSSQCIDLVLQCRALSTEEKNGFESGFENRHHPGGNSKQITV